MKRARLYMLSLFVGLMVAASVAVAYARLGKGLTRTWCSDIVSVTATDAEVEHVRTRVISDCTTERWYRGRVLLTIQGCEGAPATIWSNINIHTVTSLNACGDGTTDGEIELTYLAQKIAVKTRLIATNHADGDAQVLTGMIDGRSAGKAHPPFLVRAVFEATFEQDAEGIWQYTSLEANGILNPHERPE